MPQHSRLGSVPLIREQRRLQAQSSPSVSKQNQLCPPFTALRPAPSPAYHSAENSSRKQRADKEQQTAEETTSAEWLKAPGRRRRHLHVRERPRVGALPVGLSRAVHLRIERVGPFALEGEGSRVRGRGRDKQLKTLTQNNINCMSCVALRANPRGARGGQVGAAGAARLQAVENLLRSHPINHERLGARAQALRARERDGRETGRKERDEGSCNAAVQAIGGSASDGRCARSIGACGGLWAE